MLCFLHAHIVFEKCVQIKFYLALRPFGYFRILSLDTDVDGEATGVCVWYAYVLYMEIFKSAHCNLWKLSQFYLRKVQEGMNDRHAFFPAYW